MGSLLGGNSAKSAANAQVQAANVASQTERDQFNQTQANLSPYMATGKAANNALLDLTGLSGYAAGKTPTYDYDAYDKAMGDYNNSLSQYNSASAISPADRARLYGILPSSVANQLLGSSPAAKPTAPDLSNYITGYSGGGSPSDVTNSTLLSPITMDESTLEQTPGYQFNLNQGLKATQNAAAARGLGNSGAALKGAATYATGLADSTYQNQFNNAVTNQTNIFNRLLGLSGNGQNAAANLGSTGAQTASNVASNTIGAGNATAAGTMYGTNATNNLLNTGLAYGLSGGQYGGGLSGAGSALTNGIGALTGFTGGSFDVGAALSGLPWSDERLKENVVPLGTENGWPVYEFSYKGDPARFVGVMAQDVMTTMPDAVRKIGDYYAVDYGKLGVEFRRVA